MAQNEMKAKAALPERVSSMEGLGVTRSEQPVALLLPVWRDGEYDHLAVLFTIYNRERKAFDFGLSCSCGARRSAAWEPNDQSE